MCISAVGLSLELMTEFRDSTVCVLKVGFAIVFSRSDLGGYVLVVGGSLPRAPSLKNRPEKSNRRFNREGFAQNQDPSLRFRAVS